MLFYVFCHIGDVRTAKDYIRNALDINPWAAHLSTLLISLNAKTNHINDKTRSIAGTEMRGRSSFFSSIRRASRKDRKTASEGDDEWSAVNSNLRKKRGGSTSSTRKRSGASGSKSESNSDSSDNSSTIIDDRNSNNNSISRSESDDKSSESNSALPKDEGETDSRK